MDTQNGSFQDRMKDVSGMGITCTECSTKIDKLPFEPTQRQDGTYGRLYCYDCNKKRKPAFKSGGFGR